MFSPTMTIYSLFFLFYLTLMLRSVNGYPNFIVPLSLSGEESLCKRSFENSNKSLKYCEHQEYDKMTCNIRGVKQEFEYCRSNRGEECHQFKHCRISMTCSEEHKNCTGSATLTKRIPYFTQHFMCALMQADEDEDEENCKIFGRKLNGCGVMKCLKGPLDTCGTHMYSPLGECAAGLQCIDGVCKWPQHQLPSWNIPRFEDKIKKNSVSKRKYYHADTMFEKQNDLIRNAINEIFPLSSDKDTAAEEYYYD